MKRVILSLATALFALSSVLLSPLSVFATDGKYDPDFYSKNNIVIYDPNDSVCGSGTSSVTSVTGTDNEQKIFNYWVAAGLSPAQAAGVTGSMQAESGFSPFRQEDSQTWPNGGYGLAQFTDGQRTAVTRSLSSSLGSTFSQYYLSQYGGPTDASTGYVPSGIPPTVNDQFLKGELDYLSGYINGFTPSTISARTSALQSDFGMTVPSGQKLFDYLKTLTTASQAAEAWTYLYEYPGNIKATATVRASNGEAVLQKYSGGSSGATAADNSSCGTSGGTVGMGGLTYDQALSFQKEYYNNRWSYFNSFWSAPGQSNQCTALVYYFNTRFVTAGTGQGDGTSVASNLISNFPNFYKSVSKTSVQPFTIFSWHNSGAGHTGVILGVGTDGSIIVAETNVYEVSSASGLMQENYLGNKSNTKDGAIEVEQWKSIDAWISANSAFYTGPTLAAPVNESAVLTKVQASL